MLAAFADEGQTPAPLFRPTLARLLLKKESRAQRKTHAIRGQYVPIQVASLLSGRIALVSTASGSDRVVDSTDDLVLGARTPSSALSAQRELFFTP